MLILRVPDFFEIIFLKMRIIEVFDVFLLLFLLFATANEKDCRKMRAANQSTNSQSLDHSTDDLSM